MRSNAGGAGGLRVYHVAVQMSARVAQAARRARCSNSLREQLLRASESVVLNIAEGAGELTRRQKLNFFRIAHGSALECSAALEMLSARDPRSNTAQPRSDLVLIARMLTRLITRLSTPDPA